jgi:hypothetical protein
MNENAKAAAAARVKPAIRKKPSYEITFQNKATLMPSCLI